MSKIEGFGETRNVEITILVDNWADLMLKSTETVKRFTDEPLLAEHGFSALVELKDAGLTVLWDAGMSRVALLENVQRMKIDLAQVDKVALSHGHPDHYAALSDVIGKVARRPVPREWARDASVEEIRAWVVGQKVPLVLHPAVLRERWGIAKDGRKYGPHLVPHEEWESAGAEPVVSEGPSRLGPGCWTTGAVPRRSFEQSGTPASMAYRQGPEFLRDYLEDDQSIVINVKDKGLVVLTGCAHSGIVNTVNYAREIGGVQRVHAILGGFHLGRASDDQIERTIDEIAAHGPALIAPSHCTGFKAIARFAARMPEVFVLGAVGTRYLF
jgi:7,8-dihydropterin-6-yl-methyl-4-(beta-D-ribofuranosyl)aminobenzene 5'-phosphate synthase